MTTLEWAMVGFGGFLGAVVRYFASRKMNNVRSLPFGTLTVNFGGSLLIGIVFGMDLAKLWTLFFASGFAGALTTFSTMKKEILGLWQSEENKKKEALLYIVVTYGGGLLLALVGYGIGSFFR